MPELPEVHTTSTGLKRLVCGLKIIDAWTNYNSPYFKGKDTIKDKDFFKFFKNTIINSKIVDVQRRGKNILIHLDNKHTVLIHMKMTGHVMYGQYKKTKNKHDPWKAIHPGPLRDDKFNSRIRFVITLSNNKHIVLSDMRKFAKVTLIQTPTLSDSLHIKDLGIEPFDKKFNYKVFIEIISKKAKSPIKQVLMDQTLIVGIGNIYSDEILWASNVHPESKPKNIPEKSKRLMYENIKKILKKGIDFGGDSMSDYRNVHGEKGKFQNKHNVYQRKGEKCLKKSCSGIIERKVIGGRSAHFCPKHQILY